MRNTKKKVMKKRGEMHAREREGWRTIYLVRARDSRGIKERTMDGEGNGGTGRKEKSSARSRIERRYKERKGSARETVNEEEAHKHDVCEPKVSNLRSVLRQL